MPPERTQHDHITIELSTTGRRRRTSAHSPVPPIISWIFFPLLLLLLSLGTAEGRRRGGFFYDGGWGGERKLEYRAPRCRSHVASVEDFGGVGDGVTPNTRAFQAAVDYLSRFRSNGGGLLYVPPGRWVTGSFNLTSCFTLFLHRHATILGSQDFNEWPLIDPLPSYGRGRDAPGGRYSSLIQGYNLTDVVITGDNGTIDGQGSIWWTKYRNKELQYTRGYLVEILYSTGVLISNLTFVNSPSWNIHPVYSSNVSVSGVTILAPIHSPNTDGINPDSCSDVVIEDCYVVSGDDCVAIKSGWDEYGIRFGMPSRRITVRRLFCISPTSAVIALGSEMSGGIHDVRAEDITAVDSESGVRIKTAIGRGGYVRDIFVRRMSLHTMKWLFWMTGAYGDHPDDGYDRAAVPVVQDINYGDVVADNVTMVARLEGIQGAPFSGICMSNVTAEVAKSKKPAWTCTDVEGAATAISPKQCPELQELEGGASSSCPFPEDFSGAKNKVELRECCIYV